VLCLFFVLPQLDAQQIKYAEYFFDNDPGRGNATSVAITQANTVVADYSISTNSLSLGIHFLYFRIKDTDNRWSLANSRLVYITTSVANSSIVGAEYFFDNDPGIGNATSVSFTAGNNVNFDKIISTSGLATGIHTLHFRVKNAAQHWSLNSSRLVYIINNAAVSNIVAAEYFIDNDPGIGSGTAISLTAGANVDISTTISVSALDMGLHNLYVRVKDAGGKWSLSLA
jgi:hypothetical protein